MTQAEQLKRVLKLHQLFHDGKIPTLAQHEVNPGLPKGSRENYLYFTLPPSINFQRQSPAMWASALKTWNDPETNYLFFPEKVAEKTREQVQKDLLKHKLALQLNKHTDIWMAVCKAFHAHFKDDPRELFKAGDWDVVGIHPDTHVLQCSVKLGLTTPSMSSLEVAAVWKELLGNGKVAPVEMHPVLWNWSRNNFFPEV